jgi:hypothetical protein
MKTRIPFAVLAAVFFAAMSLTAPAGETANLVRFENGREMPVAEVREDGEWVTFVLEGGGELSVPKARVRKIDETEAGAVFVIGPMRTVGQAGASAGTGGSASGGGAGSPSKSAPSPGGAAGAAAGGPLLIAKPGEDTDSNEPSGSGTGTKDGSSQSPGGEIPGPIHFAVNAPAQAAVGQEFDVSVIVSGAENLGHAGFYLHYPPALLEALSAQNGGFLSSDGESSVFLQRIRNAEGFIIVGDSRFSKERGVSGSGTVLRARFRALAPGDAAFALSNILAKTPAQADIPVQGAAGASVNVAAP